MKKIRVLVLVLAFMMCATACNDKKSGGQKETKKTEVEETIVYGEEKVEPPEEVNGNGFFMQNYLDNHKGSIALISEVSSQGAEEAQPGEIDEGMELTEEDYASSAYTLFTRKSDGSWDNAPMSWGENLELESGEMIASYQLAENGDVYATAYSGRMGRKNNIQDVSCSFYCLKEDGTVTKLELEELVTEEKTDNGTPVVAYRIFPFADSFAIVTFTNGMSRMYDLESGTIQQEYPAGTAGMTDFVSDGESYVAMSGDYKTTCVYDLNSGEVENEIKNDALGDSIDGQGLYCMTLGGDGMVYIVCKSGIFSCDYLSGSKWKKVLDGGIFTPFILSAKAKPNQLVVGNDDDFYVQYSSNEGMGGFGQSKMMHYYKKNE